MLNILSNIELPSNSQIQSKKISQLESIHTDGVDVIVMDTMDSTLSPEHFVQTLRSQNDHTPIIFLTDKEMNLALCCGGHMKRDFDLETLEQKILELSLRSHTRDC